MKNVVVIVYIALFFNRIEDDLDKLLTVKSQKPPKPTTKPTAKPRLKPKPNLKPKPTPKPRFVEAGAGEDELFGAAGDTKDKNITSVKERVHASEDQDLFDQARKSSFRFVTLIALHLTRIFFILKKNIVNMLSAEVSLLFTDSASYSPDPCRSRGDYTLT